MRLSFHGAAGDVTGSCTLLETDRARVLIDCGFRQGSPEAEASNAHAFPFEPASLDAVILTHAHLDHSGRLPLLTKAGFTGPILATAPTRALAGLLFKDSATQQERDAEERGGAPLYTLPEAARAFAQFRDVPYWKPAQVAPGVTIRLRDAGHILGSATVEMIVEHAGRSRRVVFSGDIGPVGAPILRDPSPPERADLLVMEATYGDRDHPAPEESLATLRSTLIEAEKQGRCVLIPAFAVGRSQQVLYHVAEMYRERLLTDLPVFLDSPMAEAATELYRKHRELYDEETRALFPATQPALEFPKLRLVASRDESAALNERRGAMVVIAGSGMCTGGRIMHHLKHRLESPETTVLFMGYQAQGTLGRALVDLAREHDAGDVGSAPARGTAGDAPRAGSAGANGAAGAEAGGGVAADAGGDGAALGAVRVLGAARSVRARVVSLRGFSAHAGRADLFAWAREASLAGPPTTVLLNHSEDPAREAFKRLLESETGERQIKTVGLPREGEGVEVG